MRSFSSGGVMAGPSIELPGSIGPTAADLHFVATTDFALLVGTVTASDGGAQLMGWRVGVGTWDGGGELPFVITNGARLTAAAANDDEALVTWTSGATVMGRRFPIGAPHPIAPLPPGTIVNLSAGGTNGGFVVAWREINGLVQATRADAGIETLATNSSWVHTLTNPTSALVMTHLGSTATMHRWQADAGAAGSWVQESMVLPVPTLGIASSPQTVFLSSTLSGSFRGRAWDPLNINNSTPDVQILPVGAALAMGASRDAERALLVFNALQNLQTAELSRNGGWTALVGTPPFSSNTLLAQRAPGVVWFDPLSAFVLAWDEELPDARMQLQWATIAPGVLNATSQAPGFVGQDGVRPALLRSPTGTRFALAFSSTTTVRQIVPVDLDAGVLTTGPALTTPQSQMPNAVLGERIATMWSVAPVFTVIANQESTNRLTRPELGPRCAAVMNGRLWFVTNDALVSTPDQTLVIGTSAPSMLQAPLASACAAASLNDPNLLYVASLENGVRLSTLLVSTGTTTPVNHLARIPGQVLVPPVLAAVDGGVVVAWAEQAGVKVGFASPAGLVGQESLGGSDVSGLSIAASPAGDVLVAWDSFDAETQSRRVMFRHLLGRRGASLDAGAAFDAGTGLDSGVVDAGGFIDAGVLFPDAGTDLDSGVVDAGRVIDAGVLFPDASVDLDAGVQDGGDADQDAGPRVDSGVADEDAGVTNAIYVPVCGCSGTGSDALPFFLLAALMLAARHRTHV